MTYSIFGAKATLANFTSVEAQFSAMPVLAQPSNTAVAVHLDEVLTKLQSLTTVLVEVARAADLRPLPPVQATLQDTIAAARTRLVRLRSQSDRDKGNAALTHLIELRRLVEP